MRQAVTSLCVNNQSSQGKPREQSEGQQLSLPWAGDCWRGSSFLCNLGPEECSASPDLGAGMGCGRAGAALQQLSCSQELLAGPWKAVGVFLFLLLPSGARLSLGRQPGAGYGALAMPQPFPWLCFYKEWLFWGSTSSQTPPWSCCPI